MRVRGRAAAGVLAAGMALTLVAAESAPATPQGTAQTSMFGADLTVTNFPALEDLQLDAVDSIGARLMELTTYATTVDDPFARTTVIPLTLPDGSTPGAVEARSDGNTSGTSVLMEYGDPLGALGLSVNPIFTTAHAGTTSAVASIQAAVAEFAALSEAIGVDITTPGATSIVGNSGAVATQGVQVSDLGLNLAALGLVSDILAQLGVDQVLALLNGLGFDDVSIDDVTDALASIEALNGLMDDELADLALLEASIEETLAELAVLDDVLGQLDGLLDLAALLLNLDLVGVLQDLGCDPTELVDLAAVVECVEGLVATAATALNTDLQAVSGIITTLEGLVTDLGLELDGLDGLLETILGLLDDLANTPLLGVSAFDIGVNAAATDSVDTSSATVLCNEVTVTVLTEDFTTPNCADGLSLVSDVAAQVTGAVTGVAGLLESALPIEGLGDLRFDVFSNLVQDVSEADGVVTATAGLDLLDMEIPSLTLDPSLVTDLLDGLGLVDVLGPLQALVNDVALTLAGFEELDGLLGDVPTTLAGLLIAVDDTGTLAGLVETAEGLLASILAFDFGSLAELVTTPGIALTIDPTSTASFQPGAPATPGAPDPDDTPELPVTGGGLALLGLVAISGAAAMRRRRN